MATIHIVFKDRKGGVDVNIKEKAQLKKLAKQDKPAVTPAQRLALETFQALAFAQQIIPDLCSPSKE